MDVCSNNRIVSAGSSAWPSLKSPQDSETNEVSLNEDIEQDVSHTRQRQLGRLFSQNTVVYGKNLVIPF